MTKCKRSRDQRKRELEKEMTSILIEELIERTLYPESWYQVMVVKLKVDPVKFWRGLPQYISDCISRPSWMMMDDLKTLVDQKVAEYYADTEKS